MEYPIAIHKDVDSEYGVSFPDLPGCVTAGESIEEARKNAVEAAELYIEDVLADGEGLPVASSIDQHVQDVDYEDVVFWSTVFIDASKLQSKRKRINITILESDLETIDAFVKSRNQKRSSFLVAAALEKVFA